jgi:hypothetical protein
MSHTNTNLDPRLPVEVLGTELEKRGGKKHLPRLSKQEPVNLTKTTTLALHPNHCPRRSSPVSSQVGILQEIDTRPYEIDSYPATREGGNWQRLH